MSSGDKQIQPSAQWHSSNIGKLSISNHMKGSGIKPPQNTAEGYIHLLKIIQDMQGRPLPN